MAFNLIYTEKAKTTINDLRTDAKTARTSRQKELYKLINKCLRLLSDNPRHPGLQTHEYSGLDNPYNSNQKVLEAYVQNNTPNAYRVFWCYGPQRNEITIIAITPHP